MGPARSGPWMPDDRTARLDRPSAWSQAGRARPSTWTSVRPLLKGLDRDQRRAVTHRHGPLLVVAGPGTGKTEVITRRIAWLIATKRARPREILALTFTDKAAAEMQARVDLLVPYGQAESAILTFHAFGDRLLREHGHELGLPGRPGSSAAPSRSCCSGSTCSSWVSTATGHWATRPVCWRPWRTCSRAPRTQGIAPEDLMRLCA